MYLVLKNIDFERMALRIELHSCSTTEYERMRGYFIYCHSLGFKTIDLTPAPPLSQPAMERATKLCEKYNVQLTRPTSADDVHINTQTSFYLRSAMRPVGEASEAYMIEYSLHCTDLDRVLDAVKYFVLLTGKSVALDGKTLSRLRLATYELTANTVDHATFLAPVNRVEINLEISNDRVVLTYKDNATVFQTINRENVSINSQIQRRRKRGLGLSMLTKLAADVDFERRGKWNCTLLTLKRKPRTIGRKTRSANMKEFTVEITPQNDKGTVVLKPIGSVDASTTPALETSFKSAIAKQQYRIVLDLSGTDFISSAGLGLILGTVATLREKNGDLILMKASEEVRDILEIMSIDDYFQMIESVDELVAPTE